jgi:hypothetical protein
LLIKLSIEYGVYLNGIMFVALLRILLLTRSLQYPRVDGDTIVHNDPAIGCDQPAGSQSVGLQGRGLNVGGTKVGD